jgi:hypothetical protein
VGGSGEHGGRLEAPAALEQALRARGGGGVSRGESSAERCRGQRFHGAGRRRDRRRPVPPRPARPTQRSAPPPVLCCPILSHPALPRPASTPSLLCPPGRCACPDARRGACRGSAAASPRSLSPQAGRQGAGETPPRGNSSPARSILRSNSRDADSGVRLEGDPSPTGRRDSVNFEDGVNFSHASERRGSTGDARVEASSEPSPERDARRASLMSGASLCRSPPTNAPS